jgi:hypothetical protein
VNDSGISLDASELGWKPGVWPPAFTLDDDKGIARNWYRGDRLNGKGGSFEGYEYTNPYLGIMRVWND